MSSVHADAVQSSLRGWILARKPTSNWTKRFILAGGLCCAPRADQGRRDALRKCGARQAAGPGPVWRLRRANEEKRGHQGASGRGRAGAVLRRQSWRLSSARDWSSVIRQHRTLISLRLPLDQSQSSVRRHHHHPRGDLTRGVSHQHKTGPVWSPNRNAILSASSHLAPGPVLGAGSYKPGSFSTRLRAAGSEQIPAPSFPPLPFRTQDPSSRPHTAAESMCLVKWCRLVGAS
jgi:hypothetical protein